MSHPTNDELKETKACPYCGAEPIGVGAGDEFLDYCPECELIIEGQVISLYDFLKERSL